jgi:hypothetical protein
MNQANINAVKWSSAELPKSTNLTSLKDLALMEAAANGCPVGPDVIARLGEESALDGYQQANHMYIWLRMSLEAVGQINTVKYLYLTGTAKRTPGAKVSANWPISVEHNALYAYGIYGPGNYTGYVLSRIMRDCLQRDQVPQLIEYVVNLADAEIENEADFVLLIAEYALSLGADRALVEKHLLSKGFILEENNLHQLYNELHYRLCLPGSIMRYPLLASAHQSIES